MTPTTTKTKSVKTETVVPRQPVVAVLGHIDHGKTTLLDYIRKTGVAAGEAGGITQHVSAYEVEHKNDEGKTKRITFIDTPGHAAFVGIRSCGARIADIAVLVVSGEDGVKPQTLEALACLKESAVPFIVALTKIDKPSASVERTKQSLAENQIYIEGYGGEIPCVPVSGVTGAGVNELLDMILLVADVENISGNPDKSAEGVVLETTRSKEKGMSATLVVKDGTLKKGMALLAGTAISPLRAMENFAGKRIVSAPPGTPVWVAGWDTMPKTGDAFLSFPSKKEAENYLEHLPQRSGKKTEQRNAAEERVIVPLVIKADTAGSLHAIEHELRKLHAEKIIPKVILAGTGDINESDVRLASGARSAVVLGFNVRVDGPAKSLAERDSVMIELHNIIYTLLERLQTILTERTPKTEVMEVRGKAKIIRFFSAVKDKQIIGGKVTEGSIGLGDEFKIIRRGAEVGSGKIRELQQQKVKTSEVLKDREFGALAEAKIEIAPGDVLETFVIVTK